MFAWNQPLDKKHARVEPRLGFVSLALTMGFAISGCGGLFVEINHLAGSTPPDLDFLKSEVLISGSGVADGSAEIVMVVRLMNSDNSPVIGYRPEYVVSVGLSVHSDSPCTVSDKNGVAICLLKANTAGIRKVKIANIGRAIVEADVSFIAPGPRRPTGEIVSSGNIGTTSRGHQIHSTVGLQHSNIRYRSPDGYTVYGSVQGGLFQ